MKRMQRVFGDLDTLLYVDGRLDGERRAAFAAHLADHPDQAERVATWSRQNEALRTLFGSVTAEPVPLWLRLGPSAAGDASRPTAGAQTVALRSLRKPAGDKSAASPPRARPHRSTSMAVSIAVMLGIAALLTLGAHTLLPQPTPADSPAAPVANAGLRPQAARAEEAFLAFAADPAHPVEIAAAQQPALDRWLQRRVGAPVRPVDLHDEGWTLLGGRLAPLGEARLGAFYVYENAAGERLGLLLARNAGPAIPVAIDAMVGGGAILSWSSDRWSVTIAANRSIDWLSRNAEALRDRVRRTVGD